MAAARANGSHAATPAAMLTQCARPGETEAGFALTDPARTERTSGETQCAITSCKVQGRLFLAPSRTLHNAILFIKIKAVEWQGGITVSAERNGGVCMHA